MNKIFIICSHEGNGILGVFDKLNKAKDYCKEQIKEPNNTEVEYDIEEWDAKTNKYITVYCQEENWES